MLEILTIFFFVGVAFVTTFAVIGATWFVLEMLDKIGLL